jgi:predicted porin
MMSNSIVESGATPTEGVVLGDELIAQTVIGLDGRYSYDKMDVLAEYFMMTNDSSAATSGDGKSHDATAFYVQGSYQVAPKIRPTVRYESLTFDAGTDAYFEILGRAEYTAMVVAVRYDLDDSNALTLEYKDTDYDVGTDTTAVILDWSFLMF